MGNTAKIERKCCPPVNHPRVHAFPRVTQPAEIYGVLILFVWETHISKKKEEGRERPSGSFSVATTTPPARGFGRKPMLRELVVSGSPLSRAVVAGTGSTAAAPLLVAPTKQVFPNFALAVFFRVYH